MQSIEEAVNYFGGEELPATVWAEKYAARNLQSVRVEVSPAQMHRRLAKEFARIEKKKFKKPYSEEYLFTLFDKFSSVIPQGSPMAGIGVEQLVSLSNCFVVAPPTDSYGGIMRTDEQMVQLCKRRGGVGTDLSHIRPDDLPTSNSARKATGVVPFMRRYSNTIREVGQAGRRGALMLTLSVHHPQILDFARIKMNPDEVTGANVSVRLSDEFLSAVKAGTTYEQRWPVDSPAPQIRRQVDARTVWKEIITCAHARAEPGLLFWDHVLRDNPAECYADVGFGTVATNPCINFRTLLLTPEGLRQVGNLEAGDVIWSQDGWVKIKAKWCTGVKDVWRYRTTTGVVYCTENHPVMQQGQQVEASQADSLDVLKGPTPASVVHNPQTVMDGLYFGDGGGTREYSNVLFIGKDDRDYFDSEVSHLILRQDQKEERHGWRVQSTLTHEDLGYTYERRIPQKFMQASPSEAASFLRGLYTANGSVVANRVTLKTASAGLVEDVQILLSSLGIRSYFTTNKPTEVEFRNGKYLCKQSYDINISRDRDKFLRLIGFIQKYKMEKLIKLVENLKPSNKPETTEQAIVSREYVSTEEVYDIEVEGPSHTFWLGGHSVHNCSEIPLSILDACRLLVVNLFACVVDPFRKKASFDFLALYDLAYVAQRLMDDLVDLEIECIDRILKKIDSDPEPEEVKRTERELWEAVRTSVVNGRRTGLGPTALGDAIAAVGLKYGSDESVAFTEEVYKTLKLAAYRSSVDMAKELGAFPVWDADKERDCPFLLRIAEEDPKLYRDMQKYGRRNIALLTTAPVGSVSLLAKIGPYFGSCSGIEPLFNDKPYTRRKKINHAEVGARVDFVDAQGDRWTEFEVKHAGIKLWSDVTGETDWKKSPYHKCCAEDLDWKQRVKLQAAAQKHIDHAISSTINLPEEVSVEKVAEIYQAAWEQGCKGITVYRKNCRTGVLVDQPTAAAAAAKRVKTAAPKRPKELKCEVHHTSVKGQPCVVLVGLLEDEPYEAFALLGGREPIFKCKSGTLAKEKRGHYRFGCEGGEWIDVTEQLSDEQAAVTRLVSTSLRHGVDTAFVVQQLEKVKGEFNGFAKAVARTLKKYIKDGTKVSGDKCDKCGSEHLVRQEGCVLCMDCGHSKCN